MGLGQICEREEAESLTTSGNSRRTNSSGVKNASAPESRAASARSVNEQTRITFANGLDSLRARTAPRNVRANRFHVGDNDSGLEPKSSCPSKRRAISRERAAGPTTRIFTLPPFAALSPFAVFGDAGLVDRMNCGAPCAVSPSPNACTPFWSIC
jgi:hypothetical protein